MSVTRREFLKDASALAVSASVKPAKTKRRTNVLMIIADDHGAWANSPYGCGGMHTPNLESLARGGTKFTEALVCTPVCSPSRMTYLTGLIPSNHGVQDFLKPPDAAGPTSKHFLAGHQTYTEVLAENGYQLAMFGKWHMGQDEHAQAGFTKWANSPGGQSEYKDPTFYHDDKVEEYKGFRENHLADYATQFLRSRDAARPFYLSVRFYAPHTPFDYQLEEDREWYTNSDLACFPDQPMHPHINPLFKKLYDKRESKVAYSALISSIDRNIGRILAALDELGLREDTLVVYTADHGYNAGQHGVWGKGNGTIPLNMYEESLRVPLIWNHAAHVRSGRTVDAMVSNYDYFDTILEYLGVPAPPNPKRAGRSYAAFLGGEKPVWRDRLFFEYASLRAVRTESLKLVSRADGWPSEMYDLAKDPHEATNVVDHPAYEAKRKQLADEIAAYFEKAGAPPPDQWRSTTNQKLPFESNARPGDPFTGAYAV